MGNSGWIGVDLDSTLARYDGWKGFNHIGDPIPEMMDRVRSWINDGITVKIFTARASNPESIPAIKDWLNKHDLPDLEVTNCKDMDMIELWDDRAVQVIPNTGMPISETSRVPSFGLINMIRKENNK